MQIIGEEYLLNNSYSTIIVDNDKIKVSGTSQISLNTNNELVNELKKSSKQKQIELLIDYFLGHNSVGGMIYGRPIGGQGSNTVISTDNKRLIISEDITKENSEKITQKYLKDRQSCLENTTHENFILSAKYYNSTMYEERFNSTEFSLAAKSEDEVYESEILFIKNMLETVFKDVEVGINSGFILIKDEERFDGFYIESKDSNSRIKLENLNHYNQVLVSLIYNHNCDVRKSKKEESVYMSKQLKMEGF